MSGYLVVGVDGSETSRLAVRWAASEAQLRGAGLKLVGAWNIPTAAYGYGFAPAFSEDLPESLEAAAKARLEEALAEAQEEYPEVRGEVTAVEGQPAAVLLEESRNADLLVVGSRGFGGFRGLLLGSVGQQCAQHSRCPVVIVRHPEEHR